VKERVWPRSDEEERSTPARRRKNQGSRDKKGEYQKGKGEPTRLDKENGV
jgi:hypothetical protein